MATVVVALLIAGLVALAVRSMIKDKKAGNRFNAAAIVSIAAVTAAGNKDLYKCKKAVYQQCYLSW